MDATDNQLMLQVREGRTAALGALFERHHQRLFNFLLRMTGSRAVAEDLVQEVFVRILRYRNSYRGDGAGFAPWMYTLARNACTDHFRKAVRRKEEPAPEGEPMSDSPIPSQHLEHEQDLERLRDALQRLAPDKREVLMLSRFDYRKFEEIAEILGCPVSTAKVRAHRALKELRKIYLGLAREARA